MQVGTTTEKSRRAQEQCWGSAVAHTVSSRHLWGSKRREGGPCDVAWAVAPPRAAAAVAELPTTPSDASPPRGADPSPEHGSAPSPYEAPSYSRAQNWMQCLPGALGHPK